eukprot:4289303-Pyramimonas_sp.AAC.1
MHFGPESSRAQSSLENELKWLWHVRPGGNPPEGIWALSDEEAQCLEEDMATCATRYLAQARENMNAPVGYSLPCDNWARLLALLYRSSQWKFCCVGRNP